MRPMHGSYRVTLSKRTETFSPGHADATATTIATVTVATRPFSGVRAGGRPHERRGSYPPGWGIAVIASPCRTGCVMTSDAKGELRPMPSDEERFNRL